MCYVERNLYHSVRRSVNALGNNFNLLPVFEVNFLRFFSYSSREC